MTDSDVKISVVLPVWRQAGLADEAINSVLKQRGCVDWSLIIVNDGCPDRETALSLEAWRQRAPGNITLLTQGNNGLAAARNAGIAYALCKVNPDAVFFLDADNRLDENAFQLFAALLKAQPDHDWFYPNFDMFGLEESQSHGGVWSLSRMAVSNLCDAGSLVRRRVFDAGLRFAPDLRSGFEDWDFWLSAAGMGFQGYAVSNSFFRYRKRGQSMLSAAHSDGQARVKSLQSRHPWLFHRGTLAAVYAREWPRFAFVSADGSAVFSDWPEGVRLASTKVLRQWFAADVSPFESGRPASWVFGTPAAYDYLNRIGRLGSVLLELESCNADGHIGVVRFKPADDIAIFPAMRCVDKGWEAIADAAILALPSQHIAQALEGRDLLDRMTRLTERGVIAPFLVNAPNPPSLGLDAVETAVSWVGSISESDHHFAERADARPWRKPAKLVSPANLAAEVKKLNMGGLLLPGQKRVGRDIGFVLPILRFGGVEKCVVALAAALRKQGATPHLFIYGDQPAQADAWLSAPFETVHQMTRPELRDWSGARYLGSADGRAPSHWLAGRLFGPLTAMDVVVNAGSGPISSATGTLRRHGVKTASWEHLVDTTLFGRPNGTPYLALSNEAAYDLVLTCSHQLVDWLAGMGISRDKLLCLPNGPGFPDVQTHRQRRDTALPLRVGFMGRLDRQKGVDRFVAIATALKGDGFVFSLVGEAVVEGDVAAVPDWIHRYPLARTPGELSAAYARLDVLLMPSRAEGLPLAVLEAQRAGVVPVISDVGAVREAVTDGENGVLLNPQAVVPEAIAALSRLAGDRDALHHMAIAPVPQDRWAENAAILLSALGLAPLA